MQDIIAILIVVLAAAFLLRRAWQRLAHRSGNGCGACSNCPSSDSVTRQQLVTINQLTIRN